MAGTVLVKISFLHGKVTYLYLRMHQLVCCITNVSISISIHPSCLYIPNMRLFRFPYLLQKPDIKYFSVQQQCLWYLLSNILRAKREISSIKNQFKTHCFSLDVNNPYYYLIRQFLLGILVSNNKTFQHFY